MNPSPCAGANSAEERRPYFGVGVPFGDEFGIDVVESPQWNDYGPGFDSQHLHNAVRPMAEGAPPQKSWFGRIVD